MLPTKLRRRPCLLCHLEFARDEQLLRGREGYALVTLQAALHYLNSSNDFKSDIFSDPKDIKDLIDDDQEDHE